MMVTIDQSVSSISKIFCSSALGLVDRMGDTLVRGEEGGRKVVSVRGSGGLRYTLLRVHPASNVRQEDSHIHSYGSYCLASTASSRPCPATTGSSSSGRGLSKMWRLLPG